MTTERVRRTGPVAEVSRPVVRLLAALAVVPLLRLAVARYAVPPDCPDRTACDGCAAPIGLDRPLPALGPAARCPAAGRRRRTSSKGDTSRESVRAFRHTWWSTSVSVYQYFIH
ncbi:hypothetical protein MCBG_03694 [Micromonospora sp. M42]|nr:hypothetical protein MCBG_03694 [Micromonospora sp. M42]